MSSINEFKEIKDQNYYMVLTNTIDNCQCTRVNMRNLDVLLFLGKLKETAGTIKVKLEMLSEDYYSILLRCAKKNNMNKDAPIGDIIEQSMNDYVKWNISANRGSEAIYKNAIVCGGVVNDVRRLIDNIDKVIRRLQESIKTADSSDDRIGKTNYENAFSIYNISDYGDVSSNMKELNKIYTGKEPFSKESVQLKIKTMRAFKSIVINIFNKTFGKNSPFAELNLIDDLIV